MGFSGKRKKAAAPPSPLVRIGLGKRGPATFPTPPIPSPFLPFWWTPTRTWSPSRNPSPGRTFALAGLLLLHPLYTGAGGTPKRHKLIYGSFLSRVRCPLPPNSTSIISLQCLGEALRR